MAKTKKVPVDEVLKVPGSRTDALVMVTCPMGTVLQGEYCSRMVQVHLRSERQRVALRRLRMALNADAARLESGRIVDTNADAVRWFLEQLGKEDD